MKYAARIALLILGGLLLFSNSTWADTHNVGSGQTYHNLAELANSHLFNSGDTIVLFNDDDSLSGLPANFEKLTIKTAAGKQITISQNPNRPEPQKGGLFYFETPITLHLSNLIIANSTAQGEAEAGVSRHRGSDATDSGRGGALYALGLLDLSGSQNVFFENNHALADQTSANNSNNSGHGGALYGNMLDLTHISQVLFTGNQARGGNAAGSANAAGSGQGGAIFAGTAYLDMTGASGVLFRENVAQGGWALSGSGVNADNSGLGGAIFLSPTQRAVIAGAEFHDNRANTDNTDDLTSGRGGAIFSTATELTLLAERGQDLVFKGNTHNPGNSGAVPNSIYFGNIGSNPLESLFTVHTEASATVYMYDPLASQAAELVSKSGVLQSDLFLEIEKTGPGSWLLAGHNEMASATSWTVSEGTLFLERNPYVSNLTLGAARLELSHATEATFTLGGGARLLLTPLADPHLISALTINLQSGSQVGIFDGGAFSYYALPATDTPLLSLRAGESLSNYSQILNPNGTFTVGFYDYNYGLYWQENDALSQDLMIWLENASDPDDPDPGPVDPGPTPLPSYNPEVGAADATGAPSVIAWQTYAGRRLDDRLDTQFDMFLPSLNPQGSDSQDNSGLWFTPGFRYSSGGTLGDYKVRTPESGLGYDYRFGQKGFVGAALFIARPDFRSNYTKIDSESLDLAAYGGVLLPGDLELAMLVGWGHTRYEQKRKVYDESYKSRYGADVWNLGLKLSRLFILDENWSFRPQASYNFLTLNVDGYRESQGTYALEVKSRTENLHIFKTGVDIMWTNPTGYFLTVKAAYTGVFGDVRPRAQAIFIQDPDRFVHTSLGEKLDQDYLGLGLKGGVPLNEDWRLRVNAYYEVSKNTHSGNFSLSLDLGF